MTLVRAAVLARELRPTAGRMAITPFACGRR